MAINLPPERDLTLIFERDDVKDAFVGHCFNAHTTEESMRRCLLCTFFRVTLANAINEWKTICELARSSPELGDDHAGNGK